MWRSNLRGDVVTKEPAVERNIECHVTGSHFHVDLQLSHPTTLPFRVSFARQSKVVYDKSSFGSSVTTLWGS